MDMVYCVIGIKFKNKELYTDYFASKDLALNAAWKLGSSLTNDDRHNFISNPDPVNNGSADEQIWVFVDSDEAYVAVEYRLVVENNDQITIDDPFNLDPVKLEELKRFVESLTHNSFDHLLGQVTSLLLNDSMVSLPDPVALPPTVQDDPFADNLPGGFTYDNKPLTIGDIKADPYCSHSIYSLSDAQKTALVTARIRKMPNYYYKDIAPANNRLQSLALEEIKNKTSLGEDIVRYEIAILENFVIDLQTDEESSSSSSDEEDNSDF